MPILGRSKKKRETTFFAQEHNSSYSFGPVTERPYVGSSNGYVPRPSFQSSESVLPIRERSSSQELSDIEVIRRNELLGEQKAKEASRFLREQEALKNQQEEERLQARREQEARDAERKLRIERAKREEEALEEEARRQVLRAQVEQNASEQRIRELRALVRQKRCLDIKVWHRRMDQEDDRKDAMKYCLQADDLQDNICQIVRSWEPTMFTANEREIVDRIKKEFEIAMQDYVSWRSEPPWDRDEPADMDLKGW